ncbi:MAG: hypothetical protein AVO39_10575 [delta proteobacterium MLS_D]|nr:MAG: hypothetical protein AVO39_10575 [delta proteobacterium MLS_D]
MLQSVRSCFVEGFGFRKSKKKHGREDLKFLNILREYRRFGRDCGSKKSRFCCDSRFGGARARL